MKTSTRLNQPTTKDRTWFNQQLQTFGSDFFSMPAYNLDYFELSPRRIIYPQPPERLTWQRAHLIRKHGRPHPDMWVNRVDLFAISIEGKDWERTFSANLAGIDRKIQLRAQQEISENCPADATVEGQTYLSMASALTYDLMVCCKGHTAYLSPFLHHLATGELDPLEPLGGASDPIFVEGAATNYTPFSASDRQWVWAQCRLQEHDYLVLHLDKYGMVTE